MQNAIEIGIKKKSPKKLISGDFYFYKLKAYMLIFLKSLQYVCCSYDLQQYC